MGKAIYRVYRPSTFTDLIGQEHVSTTIQNQYAAGNLAHAYLFTGSRGVGKTTTARLVAKLANCEKPEKNEPCNSCSACEQIASGSSLDVYEIDAASNTDVEHVRENIIKSVRFAPNQLKKKVFIIDEVHMLSTSAFNALLKTLEEPPDHVLFVLATTEIHKVPETIVSRCQRFDFRRIPSELMLERLKGIVQKEGIDVEESVLVQIIKQSSGSARDAESLLGQILALGDKTITMKEASLVLPASTHVLVETFLGHLFEKNAKTTVDDLNNFLEQGVDLKAFLDDVLSALRERLFEDATGFVRQAITSLLEAKAHIRSEHLPQLPIELAIVELCEGKPVQNEFIQKEPENFKQPGVVSSRSTEIKIEPPVLEIPIILESEPEVPKIIIEEKVSVPLVDLPNIKTENHEAITAETTVFEEVPVISLEQVRSKWPEVFEQIRECNASLPLLMQSCEVSSINGEMVELGFGFKLYVDTVNKDKNRKVIEDVLERVHGTRMKVRAIEKKSEADETVAELIQQFGGTAG